MIARTTPTEFRLALLQWVILPVFILRALIPLGFMPDVSNGGGMVICSGFDGKEIPAPHDAKASGDMPRSFSGLGSALAPETIIITLPAFTARDVVIPSRDDATRIFSHGYQTRAPPAA